MITAPARILGGSRRQRPGRAALRLVLAVALAGALAAPLMAPVAARAGASDGPVVEPAGGGNELAAGLATAAGVQPGAAPGPGGDTELVFDAVRVVERAFAHHLGVRAAQLQFWLGQARAQETRVALRPTVSLSAMPFGFGQEVTEPDIDMDGLRRAWDEGDWGRVLEIILDFLSRIENGQLPQRQRMVDGSGYRVTLSARVPLWRSPLQQAFELLASLEGDQARDDLESAIGGAIVQSLDAYYSVLRAQAALRVAEAAYQEAQWRAEERAAQVAAGTATEIDRLQAEAERYAAQAELVRARGELTAARMALSQSLGYPVETELEVVETRIPPVWPGLEEALELAPERGDVVQARRNLERARAAQTVAEEQAKPVLQLVGRYRWPDVELNVSVDRHGYLSAQALTSRQFVNGQAIGSETPSWMAGVELQWPLADGGQRQVQLAQAALQAQLAGLQVEQLEQSARTEVLAAHARLMAAVEALDGAAQGVEAARRGLAVAHELRAAGAATAGDVLRAETAVARAEQARLEATYMVTLAQAAYLQAAGVLVPTYLDILAREGVSIEVDLELPQLAP